MAVLKFIQKNAWWLISILYAGIIVCYDNIPVFWDMYGQVKTAHYFIETDFKNLLPNGNGFTDNGYFPLYTVYLAAWFKVFGFNLWAAHLSVLPFITGLLYQLQVFCKRFLSDQQTLMALILVLLHPAIEAQSIYFSSEICFVFCSVWMINAVKDIRASRMVLSSSLICLLNLRAIPFVLMLLVYFVFKKKQRSGWYLIFSLLVSIIWMWMHFYMSGWLFENAENIGHRTLLGFAGMAKNLFWCLVKLSDFANIIALVFIALLCFKQKKISEPLIFLLVAVAAVIAFCVPLSNPINSKYFLVIYVFTLPAFIFSIASYDKKKFAASCFIFALFLMQSNWLAKPNKYGNAWDCNLQSLSYFDLRKELDDYVLASNISPADVAAGFQVYFNDAYYLMNGTHKEYALLSDTEMNTNLYIADSNICNNYNKERTAYLAKNYKPVQSFVKGNVYIHLFKKK
jgi:hypothetical protein